MTRNRPADWLMFAWLTLGYAVIHIIVAAWGYSILHGLGQNAVSENLQVFEDDGPLIQSYDSGSGRVTYRRLDGSAIPGTIGMHASGAVLDKSLEGEPYSWEGRLAAFIDFQSPTVNWYLVAPPDHPGSAYFVGYEQLSCRLVGHIGQQGFSAMLPPPEQFFRISPSMHSAFYGAVVATQSPYLQRAYEPTSGYYGRENIDAANAAPDAVWLLSAGTLYEIRLGTRQVRVVLENRPEFQTLVSSRFKRDGKAYLQLLTRTDRAVVIIDPTTRDEQSIELDPPSSGISTYYQLANGQRLIVWTTNSPEQNVAATSRILWLDANGTVERTEDVALAQSNMTTRDLTIGAPLILPTPIIPAVVAWIAPLVEPRTVAGAKSYSERVRYYFGMFGVWFTVSLAIGLFAGWSCRRRERDVFGNDGWLWPVIVGLCGWFGWVGYIGLRPLPARLPNGTWLPSQPEPGRVLGTEIFA